MKYKEFYISDSNGKSNCIVRTYSKLFNKEYDQVQNELIEISKKLGYDSYTEVEVFEDYLKSNNYSIINIDNDIKIKDLDLELGSYAVFCYDKKDYYHMVPIINNIVYDKSDECLDLYVIKIYKENN
ncbi:MAG: hypothetical protein E7160_01505 [Firmicutes bacterium]|nr:hypothetical protein [Bacillota bacterium]